MFAIPSLLRSACFTDQIVIYSYQRGGHHKLNFEKFSNSETDNISRLSVKRRLKDEVLCLVLFCSYGMVLEMSNMQIWCIFQNFELTTASSLDQRGESNRCIGKGSISFSDKSMVYWDSSCSLEIDLKIYF